MDVVRFGTGNRRPEGPPGTVGITGQVIHTDGRGLVSELAFARNARIEPHSNPNTTWFVVIEGGGWVEVGEDRSRVYAGEAVLWPAAIPHAAWTDLTEMRAIVVEFAGADDCVYFGNVLLDLVAVALDEAAGYDDALGFSAVLLLVLDHLEDGVDGLLLGGVDEAAGVDDDDLGVFGAGGELGSVVVEEAHHDLGVDEVFGAAERDEAYFGAGVGRDFLA